MMAEPGNKRILCVGLICVDLVSVCETYPEEDTDQRYPGFVDDSLLSVAPIVGFCHYSMYCCALCVHSSFAIILIGKRELVALLS